MNGPQLNIIASILDLIKTFIEIIVASKRGPLARIGKRHKNCVIKTGPTEKFNYST